jgi:hypothetical protein
MRYLKTLLIAVVVVATSVGVVFAEDAPLSISLGGRIGFVVNTKGGSDNFINSNWLGTMPNYAESHYLGISFSKKVTSESGAWAQTDVYIDKWGLVDFDTQGMEGFRYRDFKLTVGGIEALGAATITAGAYRPGAGWIGQQDTSFIGFGGMGLGLNNLGGMFSMHYLTQDSGTDGYVDLGEATSHTFVAIVNIPVVEVWGAVTYQPTDENGDALTSVYAGAIYKAPVMGIQAGVVFATNQLARGQWNIGSDPKNQANVNDPAAGLDESLAATTVALAIWSGGMNLAEGLVLTPALQYQMLILPEDSTWGKDAAGNPIVLGDEVTLNKLGVSLRLSKALNSVMAIVPTVGYYREWDDVSGSDPLQVIQGTLALEVGVNGQKFQLYGTVTSQDSEHEMSGAFNGETTSIHIGTLVTFWM